MNNSSYQIFDNKVIIRLRDRISDKSEDLLSSGLFLEILQRCIVELQRRNSRLLGIFDHAEISSEDINTLVDTLHYLIRLPPENVQKIVDGSAQFFRDRVLFNDFIEFLYNYWRNLQRLIVCDSQGDSFDERPYRTFNNTVETLMHVVRGTYRDIQENITGNHPRIYRQVRAGAEIAAIALPKDIPYEDPACKKLNQISVIRQVLIYPPLIFNPPMNKRKGVFERVYKNPLDNLELDSNQYLCYPARVGKLLVMIYFTVHYFELGFSMCNLFELANDEEIEKKPDAVFVFGTPETANPAKTGSATVFYEDEKNDLLIGVIPERDEFGYFGYIKKMVLTLHNIKMMRSGLMPFHGALVNLTLRDKGAVTVLVMGDTGAGKSETLEALRSVGGEEVVDIATVADDMGSLSIDDSGRIIGFGTETGAFVRLDDLQPGYAFGQIDRTIIMSPNQTNARVVLPVTTYETVVKGFPVDIVLYANNYEDVDAQHPIIERFQDCEVALSVFRDGKVMSKGTTTTTGLVQTYFANVFGPQQYQELHEGLAKKTFNALFAKAVYVGQIRTRLGLPGMERQGPEESARALLEIVKQQAH
jgi:hypothetical protein